MKNNLVLIDDKGKYVVECLNDEFEFVHNTVDLSNWFTQKTLASMFGVSQPSISQSLKTVKQNINDNIRDSYIIKLGVKSKRNNSNMLFYNFKVVTMLASRINTPEAFDMLEWIDSSLNTMFNVATGKTELDTQMDKLKNLYEVEEFKANGYLQAYKHVIKFDEETANIIYNKHKISKANALNCWEILANNKALHKRADEVINTIEPRTDGSEQLKLI